MVRRVVEEKQRAAKVADDFGVSERTVRKWLARWRAGGAPALNDRSSAPVRQRQRSPEQVGAIAALRRQRLTSPTIARGLGLPLSTVGGILRRLGLSRLKRLDPRPPVVRYQREHPGELVHIDTKKLGKPLFGLGLADLVLVIALPGVPVTPLETRDTHPVDRSAYMIDICA
jgi:transposase